MQYGNRIFFQFLEFESRKEFRTERRYEMNIFYEDNEIIVVEKPVGIESQTARGFEPDMVSEIKKHINKLSTVKTEPYVGVIHRLDKPVGGIMVYAKTQKAAAALSAQAANGKMSKKYCAVVCGKLVDNVGNYVDYLLKDGKTNTSKIVDKGIKGAKQAKLNYRVLKTIEEDGKILSFVEIELLTGRHHQIRVQMAGHDTPLWGDNKYNPEFNPSLNRGAKRGSVALCSCYLAFTHPGNGRRMEFRMEPQTAIFAKFQ